jgi:hypothetical protein
MGLADRPEAMSLAHRGMTGATWRALDAARRKHLLSSAVAAAEAVNWACSLDEQLASEDPTYRARREADSQGCTLLGLRYARDRVMHQVVVTSAQDDRSFFDPRPGGILHIASSYPIWARTVALPEPEGRHKNKQEDRKMAYELYVAERGVWKPLFAALRFLTEELNGKVLLASIDQPEWYKELSTEESNAISEGPMRQE